jgi:hypothetical protein
MSHKFSITRMVEKYREFLLLVICWIACLVLPHFQKNFNLLMVISQILISIILLVTLYNILFKHSGIAKSINYKLFFIFPFTYIVSLYLIGQSNNKLYVLLNRFGSGTMFVNNNVFLYGDLAHLTTASDCATPIQIGKIICDPFSRPLNQNPDVISFLRLLNFSNVVWLGLISTLLFFALMILISSKNQINQVTLLITLLSPPIVLAIDRGNEIITILLIISSLNLLIGNRIKQNIGATLLVVSAFFKLWPILIVLCMLIFLWKHLFIFAKGIMLLPIIYWAINFESAVQMVRFTDRGNPNGLSFGIQHYFNSSISFIYIVIFLVTTLVFAVYYFFRVINLFIKKEQTFSYLAILNSLLLVYVVIWALGTSYVYRLIIFIPILIYLNKVFIVNRSLLQLESLILLTLLTSRLSITSIFTNLIAVIFSMILMRQLIQNINITKNAGVE